MEMRIKYRVRREVEAVVITNARNIDTRLFASKLGVSQAQAQYMLRTRRIEPKYWPIIRRLKDSEVEKGRNEK